MMRVLLYLWPSPVTLLGMLLALIARSSGGTLQRVDGVFESAGGWPARVLRYGFPFSGAVAAITLGHVVVAVSLDALTATRARACACEAIRALGCVAAGFVPSGRVNCLAQGRQPLSR